MNWACCPAKRKASRIRLSAFRPSVLVHLMRHFTASQPHSRDWRGQSSGQSAVLEGVCPFCRRGGRRSQANIAGRDGKAKCPAGESARTARETLLVPREELRSG